MKTNITPEALGVVADVVNALPVHDDELAQQVLAICFKGVCTTLNMSKEEIIAAFTAIIDASEPIQKAKVPLAN